MKNSGIKNVEPLYWWGKLVMPNFQRNSTKKFNLGMNICKNMEPSGKNCKLQKTFTTVKSKRLVALENGRHLKPSEMQQ